MIDFVSQSMLMMFLRCPQQFKRRYLDGDIIPPGISARRGSATHKAAQINHEQKKETGVDMPCEDLQDAARDHYVHLIKQEGVFISKDDVSKKDKLLSSGLDATVALTKLYREELAPQINPVIVEERISLDVGLEVPLIGTIDLTTTEETLEDIKTADKSKSEKEAEHSLQLTLYSGLYRHKTGKWPKEARLRILVNLTKPKLQTLPTTRGTEQWENLLVRIKFFLDQIKTGLFPPCDPNSWICSPTWCGYYWSCKYSIEGR